MLTSSVRLDTTADPWRYNARTVSPNIGTMHGTATVRWTRVRDVADYSTPTAQLDSSSARELWRTGSNFDRQDADRKSSLRKQVLSYRTERPLDSSVAQAVDDALEFIDMIPAATLPCVEGVTEYRVLATTPQFDSSFVREQWLISSNFNRQHTDPKSNLRKQVLSYRAERPRDSSVARAVNDALKFIDLIPAMAISPHVALADDGEVNFFWRRDGLFIDVGFVGDGMIHYYVSADALGVDSDDSIQFVGRSLPRDIMETIPTLRGEYGKDPHGRVY